MGKLRFSKIVKFFTLSLLGVATAIAAVAVLSSPATAQNGGGGDVTEKSWDTDNLLYSVGGSRYSARTFGIPFHEYDGYTVRTETYRRPAGCVGFYDENNNPQQACWAESDVTRNNEPCQSGVADGFFQTVAGGRNDFPVLAITDPDGEETTEAFKDWGTSRNRGCDEFTAAQDRLVSTVASNGGYYLDSHGNLATGSLPVHVLSSRSLAPSRVGWDSRGGFWIHRGTVGATAGSGYVSRVDAGSTLAVSPAGTPLTVPTPNWPATKHENGNVSWSSLTSFNSAGHLALPMAIGGTSSGVWCPTGFHPRGEDGLQRVGRGSGRTLTSLASDTKIAQADKFWCRSDVRYRIRYKKQTHSQTCGPSPRTACPSGVTLPNDRFSAYGRVNCYYTVISLDTVNSNTCRYYHPIPQCTDPDSNAKREYTSAELATYTAGEKFPAKTDGTTSCGEATAVPPPQLAGFTADACVTASLEIYENRIAGSDAEPGVAASDRTLVVASGRTAWDLDVTSPHPATASAPRDTTAGSGDPDGCADGSESRSDHASAPGDAARKQSPAPSYAASDRTNTAAPPNDADGDIDYSGAVKNMAHRYASRVAENTGAAKLAEAEAELSLLELREDGFAQWLSDYKTAADTNASRYSSYRRTPQQSGAGLAILRFNDYEANKATYAALLATRHTALSSALSAAKTAYNTTTDRTAGPSRAAVITTSSYGKGSVYSTRTDAQRTCKIRRTRTPELLLMYAPPVIAGTDTSKTADSRLDADSVASNVEFYYVDYQSTPAAERFKLYDEAEVFAVKASLGDSPPVFCASNVPSTVYVSHAAGAMSDMSAAIAAERLYSRISTDVLRPAGYSAGLPTDHCFSGAFANTVNVKIAVFDDTAHSAMNLVYLEKDPADASGMTLLASGGALTADPAVAYPGDSAQSISFYGATYSVPASLGSTAGWDVFAGSRDPGDPDPRTRKSKTG